MEPGIGEAAPSSDGKRLVDCGRFWLRCGPPSSDTWPPSPSRSSLRPYWLMGVAPGRHVENMSPLSPLQP